MVNSISSNIAASGAMNLLRSNNSDSGDLFNNLAGTNAAAAGDALFQALGGKSGRQSINGILQEQKITSTKNGIYVNMAQRIEYIQQDKLTPSSDWEKIAGYAMKTGRPMVGFIDADGLPQVQLQAESDLSKFNPQQLRKLFESMDEIAVMAHKIQANATNDEWVKKLAGAATNITLVASYVIPPQATTPNNWEQEGVLLLNNKQPMKVALDTKGDLKVVDQAFDPEINNLPYNQQRLLREAISGIAETIQNGTALYEWELQATSFANNKIPYFLEIDPYTNVISAKEVKADTITPAFLKTPPYADVGDDTPLMESVAELIKAGKPYFLDVDSTGAIVAKEVNAQSLIKYNAPSNTQASSLDVGAIVSLFA
ncbi:hypothetical protein [Magnetospirillum sp. SS-4]|uniref:hypothetical protein n=1 Tax=Magnetospirillum sp. SS-4 TaxID=2681465 RepID=UPI001574E233|nr:hypothetical protein [Magnetospirillum sp. SS-4]